MKCTDNCRFIPAASSWRRRHRSPVMAITKCRIWVPPVNCFTGAAAALRQCGRTSDGWSALWMEKNMSNTANASQYRQLLDSEYDSVSGGAVNIERLDTTITTTETSGLGPGVVDALIKSILGLLNNRG